MRRPRRRHAPASLLAALALSVTGLPAAASPSPASGFRLIGLDPLHGAAVERALRGAATRLERPECRRVLTDFRDADGAPLQDRLDALGLEPRGWLRRLVFADGFGHAFCRRPDVVALTAPGSRVVYVCGPRFRLVQAREPARAEAILLHETLHTLGLGEDPPTSAAITRRVSERCGGD